MLNSKHAKLSPCHKPVYVFMVAGKSFLTFSLHFAVFIVAFVSLTSLL
jgi:hypothetical protein